MMDGELAKWFTSLGVGGALGGMIFFFYRKDAKSYADQLAVHRSAWVEDRNLLIGVLRQNSEALTKNAISIEGLSEVVGDVRDKLHFLKPPHAERTPR